ncbi:MAG: enoyl-ACP reductase [Verrucomicrobiae bacterium]|nr:enoyl-ACP reductase [Verrucomicrobiae bacterium]
MEPQSSSAKLLEGKNALVFGVANERSIAWAIAKAWHEAGARVAFAYQSERVRENVQQLAASLDPNARTYVCDARCDEEIARVFDEVAKDFRGRLDLLLHSIAFAPREALQGRFVETTRSAFQIACEVSAYSLVALARAAAPLMSGGGSIIALSYYGAVKVVPRYNVMGVAKAALEACVRYLAHDLGPQKIRVNALSAGPVNTLAARGIPGFSEIFKHYEERAPLKRNLEPHELGGAAVFLASDMSSAITGQVLYVDCGYEIMGV